MREDGTELSETTSLCPTCLERVPGVYEARDGEVHLTRSCPEHGTTSRKVWGSLDHWEWAADFGPDPPSDGDLTVAGDHACLAVVEVTQECNLSCSYCFASSGPGGRKRSFEDVVDLLEVVREAGGARPIQLSGGEPTVRDDLPALIERAGDMGFDHVEVNTNGIRLAREDGYAKRLAEAGVTAIYLQFDGLESETYETIREADILADKHGAIEACRRADLPVILVPTVVPGVNDHEMGDVVRFGLENLDVVQSINFQPVAHFGRYAEHHERFPLDEAARRLAGEVATLDARDFLPVPCCSSYCQLATVVLAGDDGNVTPLTQFLDLDTWDALADAVDEADWMELLAGTPTGGERAATVAGCCGFESPEGGCCGPDEADESSLLPGETLPITITGFMDADAADADRLANCCLSVPTSDGDLVPFCAYNMTTEDGTYALRNRNGWGGRPVAGRPSEDGQPTEAPVAETPNPTGSPSADGGDD